MSTKNPPLPFALEQNPAPAILTGQEVERATNDITRRILDTFFTLLPSVYVSKVLGPNYSRHFLALAEALAKTQLELEEVGLDSDVDFTRPEYLWQIVGTLVFPEPQKLGIPEIDGDVSYRTFLARMTLLLLQGSSKDTLVEGVNLLAGKAVVSVLAKVDHLRSPGVLWTSRDQNSLEIDVRAPGSWTDPDTGEVIVGPLGTGFPEDPFKLERNIRRILKALAPSAVLWDYRHVFEDILETIGEDTVSWEMSSYYYDDIRKFCSGMKELTGSEGITLPGKLLFTDTARSFYKIRPGNTLEVLSGPNVRPTLGGKDTYGKGIFTVVSVRSLLSGADTVARPYTTSPTGLSGTATVALPGDITDPVQDFSFAVEGEVLTFASGPNAGTSYRLDTLAGNDGGPVGLVPAGAGITTVRLAPCLLELDRKMPEVATGQSYKITLEKFGVRKPKFVVGEDVSSQFYL
jgi:hypothetical protein